MHNSLRSQEFVCFPDVHILWCSKHRIIAHQNFTSLSSQYKYVATPTRHTSAQVSNLISYIWEPSIESNLYVEPSWTNVLVRIFLGPSPPLLCKKTSESRRHQQRMNRGRSWYYKNFKVCFGQRNPTLGHQRELCSDIMTKRRVGRLMININN